MYVTSVIAVVHLMASNLLFLPPTSTIKPKPIVISQGNEVHYVESKSTRPLEITTGQQCANGVMGLDANGLPTGTLQLNKNCYSSFNLLQAQPQHMTSSKRITFFLLYFNDHHHLAHQLHSWTKFSKESIDQLQFVIVDDGSTGGHRAVDFLKANKDKAKSLDLVVYEIDQHLDWNIGGARNLGFWVASTPWVFMNDGDIIVDPGTMDFVAALTEESSTGIQTKSSVFSSFQRVYNIPNKPEKPHPAVMLIEKKSYWLAGGCDEDFVGHYGATDPHFFFRVSRTQQLELVKVHGVMDARSVPPLMAIEDDSIPCPHDINCLPRYNGREPSRDTTHNGELFTSKRITGKWSAEYLRFTWRHVW